MSAAPLLEAVLGPEDRADYFRDLSALAAIEEVRMADDRGERLCLLDEAFEALEAGRLERARIRYTYDGRRWFDTLLVGAEGARLVRIAEDDVLSG